jgi:hypothetical protein
MDTDTSGRRPRILVEAPMHPWHAIVTEAQALHDCDVVFCGGPDATGDECPAVRGEPCPLAADADVIVAGLGLDVADGRARLASLRAQYPDTPVVVPVWRADVTRLHDLLDGCKLVVFPWTTTKFVHAVHDAARERLDAHAG